MKTTVTGLRPDFTEATAEDVWLRADEVYLEHRAPPEYTHTRHVMKPDLDSLKPYNPMKPDLEGRPLIKDAYLAFADLRMDVFRDVGTRAWVDRIAKLRSEGILDVESEWPRFQAFVIRFGSPLEFDQDQSIENMSRHARMMAVAIKCYEVWRNRTDEDVKDLRAYFDTMHDVDLIPSRFPRVRRRSFYLAEFNSDETIGRACRKWLLDYIANSSYGTRRNIAVVPSFGGEVLKDMHLKEVPYVTWKTGFRYDHLLSLMLLQLNLTIESGETTRTCKNDRCNRLFEATRGDKIFCSDRCRNNTRQRRHQHRSRGSRSE